MPVGATVPTSPTEPDNQATLVAHAARSVKWSLLYNIVPRLVTPFSMMILAVLLTPEDFGLVAIATFIIALARIVVELGFGDVVVQRQTNVEEAASIGLWVSMAVAAALYLALWIAAPWIAQAYQDAAVTGVIRVAALALPLLALTTIPKALLRRNMQFRSLFWVNSSFLIVQSIASLALALAGIGYFAIILGQLIGMLVSVALTWRMVHWRPIFVFHWPVLRSMLGFSVWIMFSGFQTWLFLYADNAIAGLFLGVQGLGIYALGFSVAVLVPGLLQAALSDVAYPMFCRQQEIPREVGRNLVKLQALTSAVLFPIAWGISAVAPSAVDLLYGQKWPGLGAVIAILVIMPGLTCIWTLNEKAYQAVGRPDMWAKLGGISLLALLPLLWIAAPYGLLIFTLARFAGAWLLPLGNVLFGTRVLDLGIREQLRGFASPLLFSVVMYVAVSLLTKQMGPLVGLNGWVKLLTISVAGALIYGVLLWLGNRDLWNRLRWSLRQVLS